MSLRPLARTVVAALVVAALAPLVLPAEARAQAAATDDRKSRAKALIVEGRARFDLGKFDEAIDLFQKAYEVYPYPEALYNIAQAHRMKKDYERAIFFYKSYLRNAPDAANREVVEARIAEMEKLDAEQKAQAKKPPQGTKQPSEGGAAVAPVPVEPVTSRRERAPWYDDAGGWWLAGGGVVLAGVGSFLVVDAARLDEEAEDPSLDDLEVLDLRDGARWRRIAGWSAVGVGGAALVLGVVKLAVPGPGERAVSLSVGPRWVGLAGTF